MNKSRVVVIKSDVGVESIAVQTDEGFLLVPGVAGTVYEGERAYEQFAGGGVGPAVPLEAVLEFIKGWKPKAAVPTPSAADVTEVIEYLNGLDLLGELKVDRAGIFYLYEFDSDDIDEVRDQLKSVGAEEQGKISDFLDPRWEVGERWQDNDSTGFEIRRKP